MSTIIALKHDDLGENLESSRDIFGLEVFTDSFGYSELTISLLDLTLTNRSMKILASLAKAAYGCKNILKRGKKRELFQHILAKSKKFKQPNDINRVVQVDFEIEKYRLTVSQVEIAKESDSSSIFVRNLA